MSQTHNSLEDVLVVLHAQGSELITLEALESSCQLIDDFNWGDEFFPNVAFQNGVRWMYDKHRRPLDDRGMPKKAIAPHGRRALLGDTDYDGELFIFEGERDWLTAVSIGLPGSICAGGVNNLDGPDRNHLAQRRKVTVVYDNDDPGKEASRKLASQLKIAECREVFIFLPPMADADFSDWCESLRDTIPADQLMGHFLNECREGAEKISKKDANRIRDRRDAEDTPTELEQDEFVNAAGDLVTLVFQPARFEPWDDTIAGKVRFCVLDVERTRASNLLVCDIRDTLEPAEPEPEEAEQDMDIPEMYRAAQAEHNQPRDAVIQTMKPMSCEKFMGMNLRLPSGVDEPASEEDVYKRIYDLIDRYWVATPSFLHIATAYTLLTYRYNDLRLDAIPYLRVFGDAGSGKSRFLRIMFEICNRAAYYTSIRPPHLYRLLQGNSGMTVVVDEFNLRESQSEGKETVDLLNAGNQRGSKVPRWNVDKSMMETIPPYCPKIFSNDVMFSDQGLLRRCISYQSGGVEVPKAKFFSVLPREFFIESAALRNLLHGYRLKKFGEEANIVRADEFTSSLSAGIRQIWVGLLSVVPESCEGHIPTMLEVAEEQDNLLDDARKNASEIEVANAAIAVAQDERAWYDDIIDYLTLHDPNQRWTQKDVNMGFQTLKIGRSRSRKPGEAGRKNYYYVAVNEEFERRLEARRIQLDTTPGDAVPNSPI